VAAERRRYALDHNFPVPIIGHFRHLPFAELVPLSEVDDGWLTRVGDDWAVLLGVHQAGLDGLITADDAMIELTKELAVLMQLRMMLVVLARTNRDPLETTGLLLLHLRRLIEQRTPAHAQLFVIHPPAATGSEKDLRGRFKERARHEKRTHVVQFASELEIPKNRLAVPIRDWYSRTPT